MKMQEKRRAILLAMAIAAMALAPDEQLVFVAYSKGAADLLEALVRYPDLAERTAAAVTLSGVISGSPRIQCCQRNFLAG